MEARWRRGFGVREEGEGPKETWEEVEEVDVV